MSTPTITDSTTAANSANTTTCREWHLREEICQVGRRLFDRFMVAGNDGNISARLDGDTFLITPSGVSKGEMQPDHMVIIDTDGALISAAAGRVPSSEFRIHALVYRMRPDVHAVVHAHPPTATGFAVAGIGLERPFLPEAVVRTGPTPLAPYTIPGGDELPESLVPFIPDHLTILMGNHGAIAYGPTLWDALANMETIELSARMLLTARQLGNVNYLTDEEIAALEARYK